MQTWRANPHDRAEVIIFIVQIWELKVVG